MTISNTTNNCGRSLSMCNLSLTTFNNVEQLYSLFSLHSACFTRAPNLSRYHAPSSIYTLYATTCQNNSSFKPISRLFRLVIPLMFQIDCLHQDYFLHPCQTKCTALDLHGTDLNPLSGLQRRCSRQDIGCPDQQLQRNVCRVPQDLLKLRQFTPCTTSRSASVWSVELDDGR